MNEPRSTSGKRPSRSGIGGRRLMRSLSFGTDDAFDFLDEENLEMWVLGPLLTEKGNTKGLKFLGNPPKGPRIGHESCRTW